MTEVNLIVPKKHISLTAIDDINTICKPFFQCTGIDCFWYARYYTDNSVILLNSNAEFHEWILGDQPGLIARWQEIDSLVKANKNTSFPNIMQSCLFANDVLPSSLIKLYIDRFNISNGFTAIRKFRDYYELCWFASNASKNLTSFYLNNFDIIEKFAVYFREVSAEIIKSYEKTKIIIPRYEAAYINFLQQSAQNMYAAGSKIQYLQEKLYLKKYPIIDDGIKVYISARELDCLKFLSKGYSQKEIGNTLNISSRTVETHLQTIKNKLGAYSTREMLSVFNASNLLQIAK